MEPISGDPVRCFLRRLNGALLLFVREAMFWVVSRTLFNPCSDRLVSDERCCENESVIANEDMRGTLNP